MRTDDFAEWLDMARGDDCNPFTGVTATLIGDSDNPPCDECGALDTMDVGAVTADTLYCDTCGLPLPPYEELEGMIDDRT